MTNGDENDDAESDERADSDESGAAEADQRTDDPELFEERVDGAADDLEAAETEGDLDAVDDTLDAIAADLENAEFDVPEPEDEDDEPENPRDGLEDRVSDLREGVEDARGPYVENITDRLGDAETAVTTSEWTERGESEAADAVEAFFETANESLSASFALDGRDQEAVATQLEEATEAIGETALDPDDDAGTIARLLEAAEALDGDLDDAQVWSDLEVREQLRRQGFYDVLEPETRRDFPPEWNAIKIYESDGEVDPILTAMEKLGSDFMEDNILDALEHMAPVEAYDQVQGLAQRRNKQAVRVLGRIGDDRACEMLHDFLGGGDVKLELVSLRALGTIGSEDSVHPVAQRLVAENPDVRSAAARALGRIGDTRAVEPLADVLADDEADAVRASAAWALNQIGTDRALDVAAEYADDRAYLVQVEGEKAASS